MERRIKIYMVRHAPVVDQIGKVYGDDVEIDLESCKENIPRLAVQLPCTKDAFWFCSGVERTVKTGEAILSVHSDDVSKIKKLELFREQDFGDLIGMSHEEAKNYIQWHLGSMFIPKPPNGESIDKFVDRVRKGLKTCAEIAISSNVNQVVIVCHRGTIRAANIIINSLPTDLFVEFVVAPLSANIYDYNFNDHSVI